MRRLGKYTLRLIWRNGFILLRCLGLIGFFRGILRELRIVKKMVGRIIRRLKIVELICL